MTPIDSFNNPSVVSIEGVKNRRILKYIAGFAVVAGVVCIYVTFIKWISKPKNVETLATNVNEQVQGILSTVSSLKLDDSKDATESKPS